MRKYAVGVFSAVMLVAMLAVPALANNHQGAGGHGLVDGHLEGANPVAGRVCVDWDGNGSFEECEDVVRPDTTGFGLTIPKAFVGTATFSAFAGPNLGDLVPAVDSLSGQPCADVLVEGAGMALCQDPRADVVKRINIYWNANAANGRPQGADGER